MTNNRTVTLPSKFTLKRILHFVRLAEQHQSEIYIQKHNCLVSAKSILGLTFLFVTVEGGDSLQLTASGHDAEQAIYRLSHFISESTLNKQ